MSELYRPGVGYYRIGAGLIDLASTHNAQLDLFNQSKSNPRLMRVYDAINQRYGTDTLFLAVQGTEQKWTMRRDLLTPQYTTKWDCVLLIKC
ncbi:DUF4113 domain-containing protein [Shewanella woodyi]|uniref:DUF4113 domain-containing protein n=1 Tax=Shewanella woodyi TaxID=60961 RepID=UPI0007F96779